MRWLDEVGDTVAAEFSDFGDVAQITRIVVRLGLAALLGFALGFEREQRGKAAGIRTHMLVAIGSALAATRSATAATRRSWASTPAYSGRMSSGSAPR